MLLGTGSVTTTKGASAVPTFVTVAVKVSSAPVFTGMKRAV
jgi:hypothetical protein